MLRACVLLLLSLEGCALYCNGWATRGCVTPSKMASLAGERQSAELIEYLHDDRSWVREEAARILGESKISAAEPELISLLRSSSERPWVRAAAARALGQLGSRAAFADLSGLAASPSSPPELKLALIDALCAYRADTSLMALAPLGSDEDILVAAKAEKAVRSRCGD
jgi:HEAT repeat protein